MGTRSATAEELIARVASGAHGVAARRELIAAGVTPKEIAHRVRIGLLIRAYAGVYRVGHRAPSVRAGYTAALKACGDGAVLCGRAAAWLHGLLRGSAPPPEVLVLTRRAVPGVAVRRTRHLDRRDVTRVDGIRVTTVPRTLVDLAAVLDEDELARACHEAGVKYRTTPAQVDAVLRRRPNSPGAEKLRAVMRGDVKVVLSKLERAFVRRLEAAGLPLPETNRVAGGRRVDCRWPEHRLTVELDGFRFHNSRQSWDADRLREREARKRGDAYRRYSYADVFEDPRYMLADLSGLLA